MASISKDMEKGLLGRETVLSEAWVGGWKSVCDWVMVHTSWNSEDVSYGVAEEVNWVIL